MTRSPLRGSPLAGSRSVQLAAPVVEPRSGVLIPPVENIKEKSPYFRTGSHLEYGGEGGLTRFARPCGGSPLTACAVCPTGCRTPVGGSHPPCGEYKEKSPYFRTGSHLDMAVRGGLTRFARPYCGAVRGGLTRFARPCGAARLLRARSVQLAAPVVEPRSGVLIPPVENIKEKSPYFRTGSHLEYGGEGGLTRFARPCGAARLLCPTGCASCRTPVGGSHPPCGEYKEKSPYFRTGSHLEYGGEGD